MKQIKSQFIGIPIKNDSASDSDSDPEDNPVTNKNLERRKFDGFIDHNVPSPSEELPSQDTPQILEIYNFNDPQDQDDDYGTYNIDDDDDDNFNIEDDDYVDDDDFNKFDDDNDGTVNIVEKIYVIPPPPPPLVFVTPFIPGGKIRPLPEHIEAACHDDIEEFCSPPTLDEDPSVHIDDYLTEMNNDIISVFFSIFKGIGNSVFLPDPSVEEPLEVIPDDKFFHIGESDPIFDHIEEISVEKKNELIDPIFNKDDINNGEVNSEGPSISNILRTFKEFKESDHKLEKLHEGFKNFFSPETRTLSDGENHFSFNAEKPPRGEKDIIRGPHDLKKDIHDREINREAHANGDSGISVMSSGRKFSAQNQRFNKFPKKDFNSKTGNNRPSPYARRARKGGSFRKLHAHHDHPPHVHPPHDHDHHDSLFNSFKHLPYSDNIGFFHHHPPPPPPPAVTFPNFDLINGQEPSEDFSHHIKHPIKHDSSEEFDQLNPPPFPFKHPPFIPGFSPIACLRENLPKLTDTCSNAINGYNQYSFPPKEPFFNHARPFMYDNMQVYSPKDNLSGGLELDWLHGILFLLLGCLSFFFIKQFYSQKIKNNRFKAQASALPARRQVEEDNSSLTTSLLNEEVV